MLEYKYTIAIAVDKYPDSGLIKNNINEIEIGIGTKPGTIIPWGNHAGFFLYIFHKFFNNETEKEEFEDILKRHQMLNNPYKIVRVEKA